MMNVAGLHQEIQYPCVRHAHNVTLSQAICAADVEHYEGSPTDIRTNKHSQ